MDSSPDSSPSPPTDYRGGLNISGQAQVHVDGDLIGGNKIVHVDAEQAYDVRGILPNPYLGLASYTYDDRAKYAGRERVIAETVAKMTVPAAATPLLFITGASGSGKSSFAQAGLLPALEKHYAALTVKHAIFRPGDKPLAALADALWRQLGLVLPDPDHLSPEVFGDLLCRNTPISQINILILDQFEELFTHSAAPTRQMLFQILEKLPPFGDARAHIIATLRADYLPELFGLPTLYEIAKGGVDLRAMTVDELRQAIQQPLGAVYPDGAKRFQPELLERLAEDSAQDAAYLPLLQVTVEQLWRKGSLTRGAYSTLTDGIKERADNVLQYCDYDAVTPGQPRSEDEQRVLLDLLLDLVEVGPDDDPRRDVRRRRTKAELAQGGEERIPLIGELAQARLLTVETVPDAARPDTWRVQVDLIHESLLTNWTRLSNAIAKRRVELRQRARFEQYLSEWLANNHSDDYLLAGVRLAEARELAARDDIASQSQDAKAYLRASNAKLEAEQQRELERERRRAETEERARLEAEKRVLYERRARRSLYAIVAGLAIVTLVTISIIVWPRVLAMATRSETVLVQEGTMHLGTHEDPFPGNYEDESAWRVHVKDFRIEKYEVTNEQYRRCVTVNACSLPLIRAPYESEAKNSLPVVNITLSQAADYCNWVSRRLPTEIEWEWSAKGNENWKYPTGNSTPNAYSINAATFVNADSTVERRRPVTDLAPDLRGTFGLAGNVAEWTVTIYEKGAPKYPPSYWTPTSSTSTMGEMYVVVRGGDFGERIERAHSTARNPTSPSFPSEITGFRCVDGPPPEELIKEE